MAIELFEVDGPEFLACALINGDESGLEERDLATLAEFLATLPKGAYVVSDTGAEPHFGRWGADRLGHSLITYVCHRIAA